MTGRDDSHEMQDSNLYSRQIAFRFLRYLVIIILFALANELLLATPIVDTRTAVVVLVFLSLIGSLVRIIQPTSESRSKDIEVPRNNPAMANLEDTLLGAHRYDSVHQETAEFINTLADNLLADGYYFAGTIENSLDAIMEVYVRGEGAKQEMVFLIETEVLTWDHLLEHRYLFLDFFEELTQKQNLVWTKNISTVICVRDMSVPLKILLSYTRPAKIRDKDYLEPWGKTEHVHEYFKIVAYVEEEKNTYTGAYKTDVFNDKLTPWLKKYFFGPGYLEAEHVWLEMGWSDLFYLDWTDGSLDGAFRYDPVHHDGREFLESLAGLLTSDGYQDAGEIKNDLGVLLDVFVRMHESGYEAVLLMETDTLTMDTFHDHRYLYREFMKEFLKETGSLSEKGFRTVVSVKTMSPSLQTLLSVWPVFPYRNAAYVCAYVEGDKKLYTMAPFHEDGFLQAHETWLSRYLPETNQQSPDPIWRDLRWGDIAGLPFKEKEIKDRIRKALNVIRGDQKQAGSDSEGELSRWERSK